MTFVLIGLLVLLALLGLPLFVALAGGSLLATYNAGLDQSRCSPSPAWYSRPAVLRNA
jgi:hypothetical protein